MLLNCSRSFRTWADRQGDRVMAKTKKIAPEDGIVLNRVIFMSALKALGVYLEATAQTAENIRLADMDPHMKEEFWHILQNQLHDINTISEGFQASMSTVIPRDEGNGMLN